MTFVPSQTQAATPINEAIQKLESEMDRYGIHTVYEGENLINGISQGTAVVCVVEQKGIKAQNKDDIPKYIEVQGIRIPTDVVAAPQPKDQRLWLNENPSLFRAQVDQQDCFNCPIPGGAQIAPENSRWVGTLSCAIKHPNGYGFLTNEHVSGLGNVTGRCCQPHGQAGWFGRFKGVGGVQFTNPNYIDAAWGDSLRSDGDYAPGTHTVGTSIYGLGKPTSRVVSPQVGMTVKKSGRTTGITTGRIVGVNASSRVQYDEGVALFRRQIVIQANSGQFSAGGDSGSHIVDQNLNHVGLLFAGGGGQTIANEIGLVLEGLGIEFF